MLRITAGSRTFLHLEVAAVGGSAHAHLDLVDQRAAEEMIAARESRVMVSARGHEDATDAMPIAPAAARRQASADAE